MSQHPGPAAGARSGSSSTWSSARPSPGTGSSGPRRWWRAAWACGSPASTSSRPAPPGCRRWSLAARRGRRRRQRRGRRADLRPHQRLAGGRVSGAPVLRAHPGPRRRVGQLRLRPRHRQRHDRHRRPRRAQVQDRPPRGGRDHPVPLRAVLRAPRTSGFLDRVLVPLEVLNLQGRSLGTRRRRPRRAPGLGGRSARACASSTPASPAGSQTHASDGMACLLVTCAERRARAQPAARDRDRASWPRPRSGPHPA